jgi:AbrB family looped-hinge helix DNA binding protein
MQVTVRISSKHQIVIPREARKALSLGAGDELLVEIEEGRLVLYPRPKDYARHLRGLHKGVWRGVDATDYVTEERKSWE